ncbi:hypothetical protein [Streptomyces sp. NPDC018693]|uniref:hypothetical protein n=1 Tax=unclassified Streptomyces TaxID=2593676 RepID=UPI0037B58FA0
MSSVSAGRIQRRGVCVAAVGGLVLAALGGGVAVAEEEPQSDQLWIQAPYEQTVTVAPAGGVAAYRSLALGLYHDNDNFTVTDGRINVDISGLAGVAEVAWPDNCTPADADGTTAVCDTGDVSVFAKTSFELKVRAVEGAALGAEGLISYSAEATGGPEGTLTTPEGWSETTVRVGSGPDLGIAHPAALTDVAPGTVLTAPSVITNTGNEAAQGFTVWMAATYGIDFVTKFPECTYPEAGESGDTKQVSCSFDTVVEPGATVELPEPLKLAVNSRALYDRFDISVQPGGDTEDLDGRDNYRAWSIGAANTADFAVRGSDVSGAAGETVDATFRFVNRGPAWVAHVFSGDAPALIDFTVPEGTTATTVPELCQPRTLDGEWIERRVGAPRYTCFLPSAAFPGLTVDYAFELRVDRVVPDATGTVVAHPERGTGHPFPFDPTPRNNTAKVVVNG